MTSLGSSSSSSTEYTVRVPKNTSKKYNIMAFNAGDKVNCSAWTQARMERDMSARRIYGEEESAEGAAGSEFGKKQREEARRKKYGIVTREFKVEDQPWILKVNGKAGKRFKGLKKGGVTENASYYIFTQCPDGAFEAFPVNGWYNFVPLAKHRTLTAEEAEEEWGRRNKVVNHFSIMLQRRFREQERGCDDDDDETEKSGKKKKKGGGGRGGELRIHDLEEDLEMSTDDSEGSMGDDGESKSKAKKKAGKGEGKKKKRKSTDKEALEDSDDGDYEGLEVDYMSDESSSDEDKEKGKPSKGENHPKGIDEASESEEESEEEKPNEEEAKEEEEEEEGKKTPVQAEKKKKKDSSGESESSDDSDIEGETASALFMKKRTPPKRAGGRGSAGSSRTGSRPGTPSTDTASTSNTLRAAASKLEQGKRPTPGPATDSPAAKRLKMEPSSQSPAPSGKSTPQPPSGKSTPSSSDVQLTEEAVRRYLIRKPMTTKDLLKKFQTKRTGLSSEQTVNVLAQILKRLNPERKNVNDKMHFYLTE
ncbi:general transcription factor IIF subunit 1 [Limanda limanda]|uniref:general transcription factor IIF subunit 1 n=1 Tax=Limanda limanda TaxID=27771 RepID=UPI0029C628EA|nr:general transcription factor IIF subunit 1 [Limanda limanda]XP_060945990.1 general transcription factor IIF subunit 1 [Limanda limanda]XP_060945991.1 general transcription factor IIF subunit 1 [Limanda limanda]